MDLSSDPLTIIDLSFDIATDLSGDPAAVSCSDLSILPNCIGTDDNFLSWSTITGVCVTGVSVDIKDGIELVESRVFLLTAPTKDRSLVVSPPKLEVLHLAGIGNDGASSSVGAWVVLTSSLPSSLNLSDVSKIIFEELSKNLPVDEFGIGIYDKKQHSVGYEYYVEHGQHSQDVDIYNDDTTSFSMQAILESKTIHIPD